MLKITSWNINSVRLRQDLVCEYLHHDMPDILCLQETKTEDMFFPHDVFKNMGYHHIIICGQKSYNGMAILSKTPLILKDNSQCEFLTGNNTRHLSVYIAEKNILLRNFYIPAGGDDADEEINPKFKHKMDFLRYLQQTLYPKPATAEIIVGDFNIAPHEHDVWSHKQLLKVVSHTPQETDMLNSIKESGAFCDIFRDLSNDTDKIYSWWSYRGKDWQKSNRGRRLDHIWCTSDLKHSVKEFKIFPDFRGKDKPSDHVPVRVTFDI